MSDPLTTRTRTPAADAGQSDDQSRDPSLIALFRQLTDDGRALIEQEVALAKAEIRANVLGITKHAGLVGAGALFVILGLLVLIAFLVIALGALLDDNYWLSSLIVGLFFVVVGGIMVLYGRKGLGRDELKPKQAVTTLLESKEWVQTEARQLRQELSGGDGRR
jgi:hypothetical protein